MTTFVTGAGGFLGRAVIAAGRAAGLDMLAMHRPASATIRDEDGSVVAGDLRQAGPWQRELAKCRHVVHCAAAAEGDLPTQLAGTVLATENLLAALPEGLERFVHISSFSVYDFSEPGRFGSLEEETRVEPNPLRRDAYTQTKLLQERMVREHCEARGVDLVIIRPGAIYGPGKDWDFGRAMQLGPFDLIFAPTARMRFVHVEDCARAIVSAIFVPVADTLVLNIVGREQPSHWRYHRIARKSGAEVGIGVPVPYFAVRAAGVAAAIASKLFFKGKARLPELLDLPRQEARWRPLRYKNDRAREVLGWEETMSLPTSVPSIVRSDD